MVKKIIFQTEFLVSGIMCYGGCGVTIQGNLSDLEELKQRQCLPEDANIIIDAEPQTLGVHRLILMIESEQKIVFNDKQHTELIENFKKKISDSGFSLIDDKHSEPQSTRVNWINIAINLAAIALTITLVLIFPPSLPLTVGLTALTVIATTLTARQHLVNFWHNLRRKQFLTMSAPISLGWALSLAHTIYHAIMMPIARGMSMVFMSYVMPTMLIGFINGLDEIKRIVFTKSARLQLQGMRSLFPQMASQYSCRFPPPFQQTLEESDDAKKACCDSMREFLQEADNTPEVVNKNALKKGLLIYVERGKCFPVNGLVVDKNTLVDASLLTGEPNQAKQIGQEVPAGALNLGQDVWIYATENCYNSTVNQLLFRANRAREAAPAKGQLFSYLYSSLIGASISASIITPWLLGIITIPMILQNVTGILFAICPCTITLAHQLPKLLSVHQRQKKGIILRDEQLLDRDDDPQIVVFDKTGTLTTGNSEVEEGVNEERLDKGLWERIYLLEEKHGAEHPIAKAICNHFNANYPPCIINDIKSPLVDEKNRGLSATVQNIPLRIGNLDYLRECGVEFPEDFKLPENKLALGYTPVYIAEENKYKGVIFIKHEVRPGIIEALKRLKQAGKKIIMLTGDNQASALGFNHQNENLFDVDSIHAGQTPAGKEDFLTKLMQKQDVNPKSVWFVGDGLNDASCARAVSDAGGVSCSISASDKAAFFTDVSLNGSLDYLFQHRKLNRFLKKNILQNQLLLAYTSLIFLAFIISFSVAGIAVSPLIPMTIMLATTFFVLFNSYRIRWSVDNALDSRPSWLKQYLASDLSLGLLVAASTLLIIAVLTSTLATGGLALPIIAFTASAAVIISTTSVLGAGLLFTVFMALGASCLASEKLAKQPELKGSSLNVENQRSTSKFTYAKEEPVVAQECGYSKDEGFTVQPTLIKFNSHSL